MTIVAPAIIALLGTSGLIVSLRPFAIFMQLTDKPDERKLHVGEIPLVGGIAMFLGIIAGLAIATGLDSGVWNLILGCALLVVVGAIDDRNNLSSLVRLATQVGAALIIIVGGDHVIADIGDPFGTGIVYLGAATIVVSVVITTTVINAFNFTDGVDGLAGSMALVAVTACAMVGGWAAPSAAIAIVVVAAIVGFLIFNFPTHRHNPRRTFMGDAGSTMLGLIVVWLTIAICQGDAREISPVVGLWFVLVPVADFFSCFMQRIANKKSPLSAGREHFHHALIRAGLSARQVVGTLTGLAALYAGIGLLGAAIGTPDWIMFPIWMTLLSTQYWIVKWLASLIANRSVSLTSSDIQST